MWTLADGKLFKFRDLKPKSNCKLCGGCGYLAHIRQDLVSEFREMRPCSCVKKVVKVQAD
ncbi:hypothetical protein LCGC14_1815690 [marine sediment metagenome]|uniref:Uncharacterized protein n=1 Tax=marine sediment metagenome TaxID=412755 RepID=A0A0F9GKK6_9ZZZZ